MPCVGYARLWASRWKTVGVWTLLLVLPLLPLSWHEAWCIGVCGLPWITPNFRVNLYRPCRLNRCTCMHVCWGSSLREGGFVCDPVRFHVGSHDAVAVPTILLCRCIRRRRALHYASKSTSSHPPIFCLCSVDTGTLNIAPFQIYRVTAVVICCTYMLGAGTICAVYHIFANKYVWM